jgi:hypothetical protein
MLIKSRLNWSIILGIVTSLAYYSFFTQAKAIDVVEKQVVATNISTATLLQALMLQEGAGSFSQNKHFKFLAVPIRSTGDFIVKQEAVLWQTQSPVFSEVFIQPNGIYQRLNPEAKYEKLVENSEFSLLLATVFTGQINPAQWQVDEDVHLVEGIDLEEKNYCLSLQPKAKQLQQLFKQVELCLPWLPKDGAAAENLPRFNLSKRHINLFDPQDNKTQISMDINSRKLTKEQAQALTYHDSLPNTDDKEERKQAKVNVH